MKYIGSCPVCGSPPVCTVKRLVDLNKIDGILLGQYLEYNVKLCGEKVPNEHFAVCGNCSCVYRAWHFTDQEINAIYSSLYLDFESKYSKDIIYNNPDLLKACSLRMYERVKNIEETHAVCIHSVFDIGGRDGFRLEKLAENGYECTVYDPIAKESCCNKVQKRNVWSNQLRKDERGDLISLCNVLEHCMHPRDIIRDCHEHLNEGGFLSIEIPVDCDDFFDWLLFYQLYRPLSVDVTHHLFFSTRAITELLETSGFVVRKVNYVTFPVYDFRVMEILAQKTENVIERGAVSGVPVKNMIFLAGSALKTIPRVVAGVLKKTALKAAKLISQSPA